jgi:DNA-binding MarR family transcriptional regulator
MVTKAQKPRSSLPVLPEVYAAGSYEPRDSAGNLLGRARDALTTALDNGFAADAELAPWELSWPQLKIIAMLAYGEESKSASDLCKSMSYDAGAMTRMIDRLESKGLIRRKRCTNDRRLVYLQLTDAGQEIWPKMKEVARKCLNSLLRGFTRDEAAQLESFLRRILENA